MCFWNFNKQDEDPKSNLDKEENSMCRTRVHKSVTNDVSYTETQGEDYSQELKKLKENNDSLGNKVIALETEKNNLFLQLGKWKQEKEQIEKNLNTVKEDCNSLNDLNVSQQRKISELNSTLDEYKRIIQASGALIDNANKAVDQIISDCKKMLVLCYQAEESSMLKEQFLVQCTKILQRQGIHVLDALDGSFDPSKQDAVSVLNTDDSSLHGTVASSVRIGFYNEKTGECDHQKVIIYQ